MYSPLLSEACIQYKASKFIRGSMILDDIRTRFLGGDLYAGTTYTRVYMVLLGPLLFRQQKRKQTVYMNGNLNKHTLDYITVLSMVNQLSITAYNKVCIKIHQFATNIRTLQKEHKTGLTSLRASVKRSSTFLSNHLIIGRNISGAVKR